MTARTMGKNDLWIAATTHLTKADLISNDNDFDHLDGVYFKVIKIPTI
jgi:tRNA(fMet)-specific endonuclease VapC